jgi:hypothetical protein
MTTSKSNQAASSSTPANQQASSPSAEGQTDPAAWLEGRDPEDANFSDLIGDIWRSDLTREQQLDLILAIARQHPSVTWLSTAWIFWRSQSGWAPSATDPFFRFYADAVVSDDRMLAESAETSLYVDVFEDLETGLAAWTWFTLQDDLSDPVWEVLLRNSGPVPWPVKLPVLVKRAEQKTGHLGVYLAIRHALFDLTGDVDDEAAGAIFSGLALEPHMLRIEEPLGYPSLEAVRLRLAETYDM